MKSSLAMFEAAILVKSMHLIKSRLKTRKRENLEIKDYINLNLKDRSDIEFTAC